MVVFLLVKDIIALKNLEKNGYIIRTKDNKDSRKVYVSITKAGEEFEINCREIFVNDITKILEYLGEKMQ
ncbi:MAG: hypothetical protein WCR54_00950 [Clostridia bacterium]